MELMLPGHSLYSQRNNELLPTSACNVTAMCQALHIGGYTFPKGKYAQEEDNLMYFILHDSRVQSFYKSIGSTANPYEIHEVLCYATNLWMGRDVCDRIHNISQNKLIELNQQHCCVLLSGHYPSYTGRSIDHITCCHDVEHDGIRMTDSWGDYHTLYTEQHAQRNVFMSWDDFYEYIKPVKGAVKCGDVVYARS